MADIFLSYSREDHARASEIAAALTAAGYEVFWDVEIPPGKSWADILEEKLAACKAAIVIWSQISTASKWVREEARLAHDRGKLIPVLIDDSAPPFGFGEIQAADLKRWHGDVGDPHWRSLLMAVAAAVERPPTEQSFKTHPLPTLPRLPLKLPFSSNAAGFVLAAIGVLALVGALALYFAQSRPAPAPVVTAETPAAPVGKVDATPEVTPHAPPSTPESSSAVAGGITRKEMSDFLTSRGYSAAFANDSLGNSIIKTAIDGVSIDVYFFDCSGERCPSIQFAAGWKVTNPPSDDTLNAWNRDKRLVRAYTSEDRAGLFAEMDLDLEHEDSTTQIESYLRLWKLLLADFKARFAL